MVLQSQWYRMLWSAALLCAFVGQVSKASPVQHSPQAMDGPWDLLWMFSPRANMFDGRKKVCQSKYIALFFEGSWGGTLVVGAPASNKFWYWPGRLVTEVQCVKCKRLPVPGKALFSLLALQDLDFGMISVLCSDLLRHGVARRVGSSSIWRTLWSHLDSLGISWHVAIAIEDCNTHFDLPGLTMDPTAPDGSVNKGLSTKDGKESSFRQLREMTHADPDEEWDLLLNLVIWSYHVKCMSCTWPQIVNC